MVGEYVHAAMKLKGGSIKMGQFLSARADIMPKELVTILGQLQDRVTAAPYAEVAQVLRSQYGRDPEQIFASIEHVAVATKNRRGKKRIWNNRDFKLIVLLF